MHLEVAAELRFRHDTWPGSSPERLLHRELAEEVRAQPPQRLHLARMDRGADSCVNRPRGAVLHELGHHPRARRPDVGHVAKRPRLHEIGDRHRQRDHGLRGALVSELRPFVALQRRHVVQKSGGHHVEVHGWPGP
jgi:hypothetical protein